MLKLPNVSLIGIDTVHPGRTMLAIQHSIRWVQYARVILVTDTVRHAPSLIRPQIHGVEFIHREQSDEKREPFPGHPPMALAYERDMLCLHAEIMTTPYVQTIEHDSAVLNHMAWDSSWLKFDFIGAPWVLHSEPNWPPCDETNNMGNGGFSLRSRKFCEATRLSTAVFKDDPRVMCSDRWFGRCCREWLEDKCRVRFASEEAGMRYSCENRIYAGEWGAHGKRTFEMNGWSGKFFGDIRP